MNKYCIDKYMIWDPAWCQSGDDRYCFCLAANRGGPLWHNQVFWMRRNKLLGFRKAANSEWEHFSTVESWPGRRFCAGSVHADGDVLRLFLSENKFQQDGWHLDQQLAFYRSDSAGPPERVGLLCPQELFKTGRCLDDGTPMFGCRDPYLLSTDGRHFLYVSGGGRRWAAPSQVIVASAPTLDGPWDWECVVCEDPEWNGIVPFLEIERVSVLRRKSEYVMLVHTMPNWVHPDMRAAMRNMMGGCDISTIWVLRSPVPWGPFTLDWDVPVVVGSTGSGLYGLQFQEVKGRAIGYGWDVRDYRCGDDCQAMLDLDRMIMRRCKGTQ